MILQVFDNGWGQAYAAKQFEQSTVDTMLAPIRNDQSRTVVVNSVWYTDDFHELVMAWCRENAPDHIVLVAMLDAAIPVPNSYQELGIPVSTAGYYPGAGHLDFWALFVDRFLQLPDTPDLLACDQMQIPFMCLNRKPHWHRQKFYARLQALDLVDRGLVSMGSGTGVALRCLPEGTIPDTLAPNAHKDHFGIPNDIVSLGNLSNWQRCFLNVVTETVYDIKHNGFVSEKIYKPIVGCRPFLVYDPDGACAWLRERGFQPYVDDFRDISDLDLAVPANLAPFLLTLCDQPCSYYRQKFIDLRDKILYNKEQFQQHVLNQKLTVQKGITCPT